MAQAAAETDTRNLHWKQNNVGSTLLQKMGWKQGTAIGSKRLQKEGGDEVSGEGLKITKRPDGLGLGAARKANVETTGHDTFHELLQNLKKEHPSEPGKDKKKNKKKKRKASDDDKDNEEDCESKRKKKKRKETIFATNKITNARVRQSKFSARNAQDMACIFGKDYTSAEIASKTLSMVESERKLKREKREKKREEALKDENNVDGHCGGNGDNNKAAEEKEERKRKRKKEKEEKRRRQHEEKLKSLGEA